LFNESVLEENEKQLQLTIRLGSLPMKLIGPKNARKVRINQAALDEFIHWHGGANKPITPHTIVGYQNGMSPPNNSETGFWTNAEIEEIRLRPSVMRQAIKDGLIEGQDAKTGFHMTLRQFALAREKLVLPKSDPPTLADGAPAPTPEEMKARNAQRLAKCQP